MRNLLNGGGTGTEGRRLADRKNSVFHDRGPHQRVAVEEEKGKDWSPPGLHLWARGGAVQEWEKNDHPKK